jgi:hypothetical protein
LACNRARAVALRHADHDLTWPPISDDAIDLDPRRSSFDAQGRERRCRARLQVCGREPYSPKSEVEREDDVAAATPCHAEVPGVQA